MPGQANLLVDRMTNKLGAARFASEWKLVTLFIGGNDLCAFCKDTVCIRERFMSSIHAVFAFLQNNTITLFDLQTPFSSFFSHLFSLPAPLSFSISHHPFHHNIPELCWDPWIQSSFPSFVIAFLYQAQSRYLICKALAASSVDFGLHDSLVSRYPSF